MLLVKSLLQHVLGPGLMLHSGILLRRRQTWSLSLGTYISAVGEQGKVVYTTGSNSVPPISLPDSALEPSFIHLLMCMYFQHVCEHSP